MPSPRRVAIFVSIQQVCMILPLFRQGYDTLTIAQMLAIPESEVANRLLMLRERQKQHNQGDRCETR